MHGYITRHLEEKIKNHLQDYPVVALLGPRQVGKSTTAKKIIKDNIYLDLELPSDLNKLTDAEAYFEQNKNKLICLDEIQQAPNIFKIIRAMVDKTNNAGQFLILGSASRDLIKQSSETLAGRISYLELTPFSILEIKKENIRKHWSRGGLPLSFLAKSKELSYNWRINYIRSFLERDIPQLGFNIPAKTLQRFWTMLAHVHAQTLNASKLADSMGVSSHTIKSYIDILEQTFLVRTLLPYEKNIKKRIIKSPKVYLRDSGLLHALLGIEDENDLFGNPIYGASWEGYCIENILTNLNKYNAYFYRTSHGAEIDLILEKGENKIAIEFKSSKSPKLSKGFYSSSKEIQPTDSYIVAPVDSSYPYGKGITVIGLKELIHKYL
ncbi:MAG: ATP-binding protein [Pseudomonadota bacterium]